MNDETRVPKDPVVADPMHLNSYAHQIAKIIEPIVTQQAWIERIVRTAALSDFAKDALAVEGLSQSLAPNLAKAAELFSVLANREELYLSLGKLGDVSRSWQDAFSAIDSLSEVLNKSILVGSQFARQVELSAIAHASMARFDLGKFEAMFNPPMVIGSLAVSLDGLFLSYRSWAGEMSLDPARIVAFPRACSVFPPVEVFNESDILADEDVEADEEIRSERERIRSEISADIEAGHETFKGYGFADLIPVLRGARDVAVRGGYDHVRHAVTSMREAVTQVLHRLAPDDGIRKWSNSEKDFDRGKPTRRARLRYIYRQVDSGTFGEFVVKDVEAVISLFDIFQQGTHGIGVEIERRKLLALVQRVECLVQFLIELGRGDEP